MRLTKKNKNDDDYSVIASYVDLFKCGDNAINKLGQLEDIEDDLGIDLITLFKAMNSGFYFIDVINGNIVFSSVVAFSCSFGIKGISVYTPRMDLLLHFKDYGKNWALTKEELE